MFKKYLLIFIGIIPLLLSAQEFTLKESPEEKQRKKELLAEKEDLKFQDHFFAAIQQRAKEDYNKAIEELESCLQIYPDDAGLNFEFTKNYFALKDYDNAVFFANKTLANKPNNISVLTFLKKIYRAQHNFEKAIEIQQQIIAIKPNKKQELIMLYVSNKQRDKAKELFLDLEKKQKLNNENYYRRILFGSRNNIHKVDGKTTTKASVKKEDNQLTEQRTIKNLRKDYLKNKDYKTLKKLLLDDETKQNYGLLAKDAENGLSLFPAQPYLYLMQGKAEINLSKFNNAVEVLNAGLDFIIDDNKMEVNFYELLVVAYKNLGNINKLKSAQTKLQKLNKH